MNQKILIVSTIILVILFTATSCKPDMTLQMSEVEQTRITTSDTDVREKTMLTLASYGNRTLPAVREFNLTQDEYYIELIDYSQGGKLSRSEALMRLNTELANGGGPDLFYLWNMGMDVDVYGSKGYLENLNIYLDYDPELSRHDLVASLIEAYEIDGVMYGTVSGFSILTMFGSHLELSSFESWDFYSIIELAQSRGGVTELFATHFSKVGFLESALLASISDFTDIKNGEAYFDSEYYRSVLEFCNLLDADPDYAKTIESPALSFYVLSSFIELQYYEALYDDEIEFVGNPTSEGVGHCFTNLSDQFAMNVYSSNKDGAWQFLRLLFTEQYQYDQYVDSGYTQFPTNINAMNKLIEKSKSAIVLIDDGGDEVEFTQRGDQEYFEYHAATDQQVEKILSLINNTKNFSSTQYELIEIVIDEASDYFSNTKSLDEVVKITQQRASIYLAERQ